MFVALAGCSAHAAKTAERSVSPLVGTWVRDGDMPTGDSKTPQFTTLAFAANGSLNAKYVASGGALGQLVGKAPQQKSEHDTYTTFGGTRMRIAEGTSYLEYHYRVDGTKLYLTPANGNAALQFTKTDAP
jgi:hypothetical protein